MKRYNFTAASDGIFSALTLFIFFFFVLRYALKNNVLALIFALMIALFFGALIFLYLKSKRKKGFSHKDDEKKCDLFAKQLCLIENPEEYVKTAFGENGEKIISFFQDLPLSFDDIALVFREYKDNAIIYSNFFDEKALALARSLNIKTKDVKELFSVLKQKNALPENYILDDKKINFSEKITMRFDKSRAKAYFFSGLGITLISYFSLYPVYYLISGGFLFLLSIVCTLFGERIKKR